MRGKRARDKDDIARAKREEGIPEMVAVKVGEDHVSHVVHFAGATKLGNRVDMLGCSGGKPGFLIRIAKQSDQRQR